MTTDSEGKDLEDRASSDTDKQFYNAVASVVHVRGPSMAGTGFIFHVEDGMAYVLTAGHVLEGGSSARYQVACISHFATPEHSRGSYPAEVVRIMQSTPGGVDLASLKFQCDSCVAAEFATDSLIECTEFFCQTIGDRKLAHLALRNNGDEFPVQVQPATTVSQHLFFEPYYLCHDAYIIEGDSGSPLINEHGKVVGINTYFSYTGEGCALYLVNDEHTRIHNTLRRLRQG